MDLCEQCNKIDFRAAGLHALGDPDYNFFSLDSTSFLEVTAKAKACSFCKIISDIFFQWAEANYGGVDHISLPEAKVGFAARKTMLLQKDNDDDHSANIGDNRSKGSAKAPPSLFRIQVHYTIRNPNGNGWIGPSVNFQKCATENNGITSMLDKSIGEKWPEQQEPYLGRIRPLLADCRLFKKWKDYCLKSHHGMCGTWFNGAKPSKIRLVDVKQECIIESTQNVEWFALSYLWGKTNTLTLGKDSLSDFKQPGFLSHDRVPRTIYDAMVLTAALGETYLWVDSLCIVQDDPADKLEYIPHMDAIYGYSTLTIVDASGSGAQSGLPGIRQGTRAQVQAPFNVQGATVVQTLDPINATSNGYLTETKWNSRGWTFQEGILSSRSLIFTAEQVYWQCNEASWCEDGFWECPNSPTVYRHGLEDELRTIWTSNQGFDEKKYRQLVEIYSQRTLTCESDGLDAFKGVLSAFEQVSDVEFLWGLPTMYLGAALTWPTEYQLREVRRRSALCRFNDSQGNPIECPFPSWSWVGWVGKIYFHEVGLFGLLTTRHAGIVFHKIYSDGKTEVINQKSEFKEKKLLYINSDSKERDPSRPFWRDESRTGIAKIDIPRAVFTRNISAITLGFWSSTAVVTVQYSPSGRSADPKLIHKGIEIEARWHQVPQHAPDLITEYARLVIIGLHTLGHARDREELVAILDSLETDEGLTYRRAMVSIRELDWNNLSDKKWEMIFLA